MRAIHVIPSQGRRLFFVVRIRQVDGAISFHELDATAKPSNKLIKFAYDCGVRIDDLLAAVDAPPATERGAMTDCVACHGVRCDVCAQTGISQRCLVVDFQGSEAVTQQPELEQALSPNPCVACGGLGKNSKGAPCICQRKSPGLGSNPNPTAAVALTAPGPSIPAAPDEPIHQPPAQIHQIADVAGPFVEDLDPEGSMVDEGELDLSGFRSTGDPVHDAQLSGVTIPEGEGAGKEPADWATNLGDQIGEVTPAEIVAAEQAAEPPPKPKCPQCGSGRAKLGENSRCLNVPGCESRAKKAGKPLLQTDEYTTTDGGEALATAGAAEVTIEGKPTNIGQPAPPSEPVVVPDVDQLWESFRCQLRGRYVKQREPEVRHFEGREPLAQLERALAVTDQPNSSPDGAVIEWGGTDHLACLDLDWHDGGAPRDPELLLAKISPWPALAWVSHGGGLHLIYEALHGFTAQELAACAALCAIDAGRRLGSAPTVEVLPRSAHPAYPRQGRACGTVHRFEQDVDDLLRQWRSKEVVAINDDRVAAYLAEKGFEMGNRYPHEQCPFDGRATSGANPVVVLEKGIKCHVCEGRGHKSRGFAGYGRLLGSYRNNQVLDAANAFVYFDQVGHLLRDEYPGYPTRLLRPAWSALLKLVSGHTDDPRVKKAMLKFFVIRSTAGTWLDSETMRPVSPRVDVSVLQLMPSTMYVKRGDPDAEPPEEPECKRDTKLLDLHRTNQTIPGFPEIMPIRGIKTWGVRNSYRGTEVRSVILSDRDDDIAPQYRSVKKRPSALVVDQYFEDHFPGVNMNYLRLLIAARGFAESGLGAVPMILVTGPTGAAKSTCVELAATVLGDRAETLDEDQEKSRFSEAIGTHGPGAGFLILDEFAKQLQGRNAVRRFYMLLRIKRRFAFRQLYVGPKQIQLCSVIVITNNAYGRDVMDDQQLGRRLAYVPLTRRAPGVWETTCGTRDVAHWRSIDDNASMCDALLSQVIDDFLPSGEQGPQTLLDVAAMLGFGSLEDHRKAAAAEGTGYGIEDAAREMFTLCCSRDTTEAPRSRWKGRGWKSVRADRSDKLSDLWRTLCDETEGAGFHASMAIAELDLASVLGSDEPIRLETRGHGRELGVRFAAGPVGFGRAAAKCKYNEEILGGVTTPAPAVVTPVMPVGAPELGSAPVTINTEGAR